VCLLVVRGVGVVMIRERGQGGGQMKLLGGVCSMRRRGSMGGPHGCQWVPTYSEQMVQGCQGHCHVAAVHVASQRNEGMYGCSGSHTPFDPDKLAGIQEASVFRQVSVVLDRTNM
jgi:hypothetical protein